ncbi:hypothetical protein BC937DRAFT_86211 [Endogone sp. FLAS-F59071]|nr:hypothetical protein BC937DRAFT_86211 [Endogone sp. FLAS-F59071]|eukprot:RUS20190.1 hypothetical protein BC937DRAFT_86211 [Endogone sp. FLAS-F59071]
MLAKPLLRGHTVLKSAFIEHIAGELGKARMHAILDLQADWPDSQDDQALEKRLAKTGAGSFLVHDDGPELLMIANKDGLFAAQDQWDHTFWFSRLRGFVDEDGAKLEFREAWVAGTNTSTANDIGVLQGKRLCKI